MSSRLSNAAIFSAVLHCVVEPLGQCQHGLGGYKTTNQPKITDITYYLPIQAGLDRRKSAFALINSNIVEPAVVGIGEVLIQFQLHIPQ